MPVPQTKLLGREYPPPAETKYVAQMLNEIRDELKEQYPTGPMLRQAHPKMHGLVKAEFIISDDIPSELKAGIFKEPQTYEAYIRFSNASGTIKPDSKKDIRGMGIKLLNVPGEKITTIEPTSQDFVLISNEIFVAKTAWEFQKTIRALTKSKLALAAYMLNPMHFGVLKRVLQGNKKCEHVLNTSFWSTTPYQFGSIDKAVKYFVSPANDQPCAVSSLDGDNYLRENLVKTLAVQDAWFDFHVQFQTDANTMPIEDPTKKWDSPFIKLASIKIPKQVFDTDEMNAFGDSLSFLGWHSLCEHRPLGGINRARKAIYEVMFELRKQRNQYTK